MRRAVLAATVGNALEFCDFITFAFFAIQIGKTFFPSDDPFVSLMGSLATFGAGFISRPLGAYLIGGYADRHGRKPAMLFSMTLMGIAIAVMALTPGYAPIGIAAPVIVVLARVAQGFALGGEVGSATTYMIEASSDERRGLSISWQGVSQNIAASVGALVGLLLSMWLSEAELTAYGWRIALLLGTVIVPFALYIRRSLPETLVHVAEQAPVGDGRSGVGRIAVIGMAIMGTLTITTYIFNYMATFGQNTLKLSASLSMAGELANNGIGVFGVLLGGWASDFLGRRPVMLAAQAVVVLAVIPCFAWLIAERDATAFIGANLILSFASALVSAPVYAAVAENLPPAIRARGFALIYSLPVTVLGGTTQLVVTWILRLTGEPMAVAWYLAGVSLIGLLAMLALRESAPVAFRRAQARA